MGRALLALLVTLFALWVRLPALRQGLWEDEATAVYVAESPSIHELVRRQSAIDYSPPLFNAVLAAYGRAFGFDEVPVKGLAIGIGALACGAATLAAAEIFGLFGGVLAGLFAAEHRLLIDMSAEVRPYSLAAALASLSFWCVFRFQRRKAAGQAHAWDLVLMAGVLSLAALSHYSGTVVVATIGAFAFGASISPRHRSLWFPVALCAAVAGIVFLPWAPIAWRQAHIGLPWAGKLRPNSVRSVATYKALSLLPGMPSGAGTATIAGIAMASATVLVSLGAVRRELRERGAALSVLFLAVVASFLVIGLQGPPVRYVTVPVALSLVLISGGLAVAIRAAAGTGTAEKGMAWAAFAVMSWTALSHARGAHAAGSAAARSGSAKTIMRAFFRDGVVRPGDLLIGAPDMIGPTLWYYAPPGVVVRGFVHWNEPAFEEFGDYARLWPDPAVVDRCLAALDRDVRQYTIRRVLLAWAVGGDGALPFKTRTDELREGIRRRFPQVSSEEFRGPGERIRIDVFAVAR